MTESCILHFGVLFITVFPIHLQGKMLTTIWNTFAFTLTFTTHAKITHYWNAKNTHDTREEYSQHMRRILTAHAKHTHNTREEYSQHT